MNDHDADDSDEIISLMERDKPVKFDGRWSLWTVRHPGVIDAAASALLDGPSVRIFSHPAVEVVVILLFVFI